MGMGETGKEQMEEKMKNGHSSHVRSPPSFQPWLRLWSASVSTLECRHRRCFAAARCIVTSRTSGQSHLTTIAL